MPRPYSEDLRWRAIWMKEMLGFQVDEVAAALWMSPRTIERYVSKVLNSGDVKAGIIGRLENSVSMHQQGKAVLIVFSASMSISRRQPRKPKIKIKGPMQ